MAAYSGVGVEEAGRVLFPLNVGTWICGRGCSRVLGVGREPGRACA